jgi:hypothetical protein
LTRDLETAASGFELALLGDPTAMRLYLERIMPPCRERTVKFALPPIESAADIAAAMKAVTSALSGGAITPGEAGTIAAVVDTFVRAIDTSDFDRRLQELEKRSKARAEADMVGAVGATASTFRRNLVADLLQTQQ